MKQCGGADLLTSRGHGSLRGHGAFSRHDVSSLYGESTGKND